MNNRLFLSPPHLSGREQELQGGQDCGDDGEDGDLGFVGYHFTLPFHQSFPSGFEPAGSKLLLS